MSRHDKPVYTENCNGKIIKIMPDESGSESPVAGNDSVVMAVLHRRYVNPARHSVVNGHDFNTMDGIAQFEAEAKDDWTIFKLFLYDHSGTSYQPSENGKNPFSCPWDSGRVGIIALHTSDFDKNANLFECAKSICEEYTSWANGEVYGYVVETEAGYELDSCWGFYGDPEGYVLEEARNAAKDYLQPVGLDSQT